MSHLRLTIFALYLMAPALAGAADGGVQLYLQPLPPEAARLTFTFASVAAVTASGTEHPLTLNVQAVGPASAGRQRLLASGRLPTGSFAGFAFKVKQAALTSAQGPVALTLPDTPVRLDFPFAIGSRRSSLVWLQFRYEDSVSSGFSFSPVFTAVVPARPIASRAAFVTNAGSNTITVVDKHLAQAVAIVDTCAGPGGMALDQRRRRLYVACSKDDEVQSIDVAGIDIVERSRLSPGDGPREIGLTPDGRTLVSVNTGSNSISLFDADPLTRLDRISVGSGPSSILIDPTGRQGFVFNTLSSSVSVVDLARRSVVATIPMDAAPLRGQFSARGDRLLVLHERSPYVTVVDPVRLTIITRARLRIGVSAIKVDARRGLVYIGDPDDRMVEFYDPTTLMPVDSMKTAGGASYLTVDAESDSLYMVSPDTRSLVIGSLAVRKVVSEIDVGEAPYWVAVMGEK